MTAPITGKRLVLSAAALFVLAAAFAGVLEWHGHNSSAQESTSVEGDPVTCPDGRSFTSSFELDGARFEVLGTLTSMEGRSAVISGPTGDVPITLSDTAEVSTGLVIGDPVKVQGTVDEFGVYIAAELIAVCVAEPTPTPGATPVPEAPAGTPTPTPAPEFKVEECNRGPGQAGDLRLEVKDGEVKIKRGTVLSFMDGTLTIDTPAGPLSVLITSDTEVRGDLSIAAEVRLEGTLDEDGAVVAEKVRALCPGEADDGADDGEADDADDADDDDDNSSDDDDDDMDGATQHMRATPAVPATPAIPGERGNPATPAVPAIPAVPPHDRNGDGNHGQDGDDDNNGHDGGHGNNSHGDDD